MIFFALTALTRSTADATLHTPLQDGDVLHAATLAQAWLDSPTAGTDAARTVNVALLCGDLLLAQDRDEEAEEAYRGAVKAAAPCERGAVRVVSCRTTGFMNLYQQRFGTAAACFRRLADDEAAGTAQRVEALCGLALAHHGMGQIAPAMESLDQAAEGAADSGQPALEMLVSVLRNDLRVQQDIRSHGELQDHVFWQLPARDAMTDAASLHPLAAVEAALTAYATQALVVRHLRHLRCLVLVTCGDERALQQSLDHLAWLRRAHLAAGERQARLETALVAIVARNAEVARSVLEPLCGRQAERGLQRWNFELSYCLARVSALSGRSDDSLRHYQRYALESVQCVRAETADPKRGGTAAGADRGAAATLKDDVAMALPAKYRRAYRYMIEHLDCATLSVREIADAIGVTERALQATFRSQLGMTPAELLRRCRVERIREELLRGDATGSSVIETAARWGIRNRSTLVSAYRKYFRETPAQTLHRGEPDRLAVA